jgi:hypothetical protein
VLADTGALLGVGNYYALLLISTDAAAAINVQRRNVGNSDNLWEQRLFYGSNQRDVIPVLFRIDALGERLRLIPNSLVTGNVSASIIWQVLA